MKSRSGLVKPGWCSKYMQFPSNSSMYYSSPAHLDFLTKFLSTPKLFLNTDTPDIFIRSLSILQQRTDSCPCLLVCFLDVRKVSMLLEFHLYYILIKPNALMLFMSDYGSLFVSQWTCVCLRPERALINQSLHADPPASSPFSGNMILPRRRAQSSASPSIILSVTVPIAHPCTVSPWSVCPDPPASPIPSSLFPCPTPARSLDRCAKWVGLGPPLQINVSGLKGGAF